MRITGTPNLAFTPQTVISNEIRPDRQIADSILVGAEAGGDIGFELSFRATDDLLQAALFSTYVRQPFREGANVGAAGANTLAVADTSGSGGGVFAPNDLIRFEGFAVVANNAVWLAIAGTDADTINATGIVAEANPPDATVKVTRVGRVGASGDITATTASGNALLSTVLDFTTLGFQVGDWIKVGDGNFPTTRSFATAALNTFVRVTAIAANRLDIFAPTTWAIDAGAGRTIALLFADRLRNGTTMQSFSAERRFTDHVPETVELFRGMVPNTFNLNLQPQAIVTGVSTLFGFNAAVFNPTAPGDYTNIYTGTITRLTAPAHDVLNTSSNVARIGRGQNPISGPNYVTEATVELNNNLRRQNAVGQFGAIGIGTGELGVSGSLNTYFGDKTLLEAVLNNTETSLDMALRDQTGRAMLIDIPRIKFTGGAPDVPGKNQDVLINLGYQGLLHPTLLYTMAAYRFHYAP